MKTILIAILCLTSFAVADEATYMIGGYDSMLYHGPIVFDFPLSHVKSASLKMAVVGGQDNDLLILDNLSLTFLSIGWEQGLPGHRDPPGMPIPEPGKVNATVVVLDLAPYLPLLDDGRLSVDVSGQVGVDWAELSVTSTMPEPGTMMVLTIGGLLVLYRKRN